MGLQITKQKPEGSSFYLPVCIGCLCILFHFLLSEELEVDLFEDHYRGCYQDDGDPGGEGEWFCLEDFAAELYDQDSGDQNEGDDTCKFTIFGEAVEDRFVLADDTGIEHIPPVDHHIESEEHTWSDA